MAQHPIALDSLGLLSTELYVNSSLVKANVSGYGLAPSGMTFPKPPTPASLAAAESSANNNKPRPTRREGSEGQGSYSHVLKVIGTYDFPTGA